MKSILKILKMTAILIVSISVVLFSASLILQDKVAEAILNSFNKSLSTKFDIGSVRLSFLRKFPKASLELKNVVVFSSSNFNPEQFTGINTDTLITAKTVSVEFNITDIIKGNYNIDRIGAKDGKIDLYSDRSGFVNYDVSVKSDNPGTEAITINLERINLDNIRASYNNLATKLIITSVISNGRLKSRITGDNIDFSAVAETEITSFKLYNTIITKPIKADLDLNLLSTREGVKLNKGTLTVENIVLGVDGFVSEDDNLDLFLTGQNVDISKIRKYLPEKYLSGVSDYNPTGILTVDCQIRGPLTRTRNPHIEVEYSLSKGQITYGKSGLTVNNLSFSGHYSNGARNMPETGSVTFNNVTGRLGSAEYSGSIVISGLNKPKSSIILKGRVYPQEIKEFFNLQEISEAGGYADVDLKMATDIWPLDKLTITDLINCRPEAAFSFNTFSIGYKNNWFLTRNISGNCFYGETIRADNLSFNFKDQDIKINGEFRNLPGWLTGSPVRLIAKADIYMDKLIPEAFLEGTNVQGKDTITKMAFSFPGDILFDINLSIGSIDYKTFSAKGIKALVTYKPRVLTFKSLSMQSLNGTISGDGFILQNNSKSVMARGSFILAKIDVNKAFTTFHNFGQDFVKAENLSGDLSGTLSVLVPLDSMLKTQYKSLTAEGKYTLENGALINFDPIKELSDFIELSELENIHFEKLENDFFIKNNFVYVPQMDVKSSAADLSVSGKHSFDNDYEYHIKILLSELLSRKRKKNKSTATEFGVVEDDGLGRTSMLLKIVNKGEDVKVSYDVKAAGTSVKNNIRSERQTMKTILNQEYGWYKSDTTVKPKPAEKKSRFRITFDETDSTKNAVNQPPAKKESTIKNIFKKK
jgi:hypothetical protein